MNKREFLEMFGFVFFAISVSSSIILLYWIINQMYKKVDIDILNGCLEIMQKYFVVQEFSGSKISSYERAVYNAMKKAINKDGKHELFK